MRTVRRAARTNNATDIGAESFKTPREQNEIAALQEEIRESNETIEEIKIKISGIETQIDSIKGFKPLIRGQLNNALAKQKRILSNEEEKLRLRNVKLARLRS